MADLAESINAELDNINGICRRLPPANALSSLSELELAGAAALVHSFYNGVENILKQVFKARSIPLPTGDSWHKELIIEANRHQIISDQTAEAIRAYLAFRHFFAHAYAFDLDPSRIEPLVANLPGVQDTFRRDIARICRI